MVQLLIEFNLSKTSLFSTHGRIHKYMFINRLNLFKFTEMKLNLIWHLNQRVTDRIKHQIIYHLNLRTDVYP